MFLKVFNEIEVCGQKSDGRTDGRTNGDIEALADARRALEKPYTQNQLGTSFLTLHTLFFLLSLVTRAFIF